MYIISYKKDGRVIQTRIQSYEFRKGLVCCVENEQTGFNFPAADFVSVVEADLINPRTLKHGDWYQFRTSPQFPWSQKLKCTRPHLDWPPYQFRKIPAPNE